MFNRMGPVEAGVGEVSAGGAAGRAAPLVLDDAGLDPGIRYPSYKSFDEFIDVERLKSLDGYVAERVRRRLSASDDIRFYTGPYRLERESPDRPGSRMIYLSRSEAPDSYFDLDRTDLWHRAPAADEFAELMAFIDTLPFKSRGRMLIMYDDAARPVPAHRDHEETEVCHDFIWFRTNLDKPFYMLDQRTGERLYVTSYSAWFDTVNQFHGSEARDGLSFSVRVDGVFTDEFKARIPVPARNLASTPSLWACRAGG